MLSDDNLQSRPFVLSCVVSSGQEAFYLFVRVVKRQRHACRRGGRCQCILYSQYGRHVLLGLAGLGFIPVPTSEWFKPIPGILQFQHFKVLKTDKYHVECRKSPTAEATLIRIVKDNGGLPENSCNLPPVLPAKGLSKKREDYLTKQVAPYFSAAAAENMPWAQVWPSTPRRIP